MEFLVLSHLRWDFVYQRPQHLLSRCAGDHRVWFWEEPVYREDIEPRLSVSRRSASLAVLQPELPAGIDEKANFEAQKRLLETFLSEQQIRDLVLWYYTPMARHFTRGLQAAATVYDCMDELSAFRGAPPGLRAAEAELFSAADLMFTGGRSLYESKRHQHSSVHCFPSSIDTKHFRKARFATEEPPDQANIPHPRIGFSGVIDERMDLPLLSGIAELRPDWHLVMIGPVVKIDHADLPRSQNIHYLGGKSYDELPQYMAGWDAAILPFARNESTMFISPTKTPEYLAAGLPVVSTSITDVVRGYGDRGLAEISDSPKEFVSALERCLEPRTPEHKQQRLAIVDGFLSQSSWDRTWREMESLIMAVVRQRTQEKENYQPVLQMSSTAD